MFFGSLQEEIHSNKLGDEERSIELILEQQEEKIIIFKPCHQEERHRAIGKRESPDGDSRLTDLKDRFSGFWLKEIARRDLIISASNKRNRQMGFQVVLDRPRGSCISILVKEGRQKGPRISLWIKGIARWDSKRWRSPEGISYFTIWRSPDGTSYYLLIKKRNRQMGFQVD